MAVNQKKTFADLRETLSLQAKIAESVHDLNARDPESARELVRQLAAVVGLANGDHGDGRRGGRSSSATLDRVIAALAKGGNRPMTKKSLGEATGLSEGSIHTLLYATQPGALIRERKPGVKGIVIRLTPEAFEEAKSRNHG